MIWGCITAHGPGPLRVVSGRMDQHQYLQILKECLPGVISKYEMDKDKVIFQHDNDPKHKAKSVQKWLDEEGYNVMEWPSQSPDLNPIENLWAILKKKVYECEPPPENLDELEVRVKEMWNTIISNECAKLVASMRDRIKKVKKAKGYWTRY
jgi:hypothetical protein